MGVGSNAGRKTALQGSREGVTPGECTGVLGEADTQDGERNISSSTTEDTESTQDTVEI